MKVLHIAQSRPYGGVPKITAQLVAAQRQVGIDARVLALYNGVHFLQELQARHLPFQHTGDAPPYHPRSWWRFMLGLKNCYDIIHLHSPLLWSLFLLSFRRKKIRLVYHAHTYPPARPGLKHRLAKFFLRRNADAIIGVSRSVTSAFRTYLSGGKIHRTIYNGIELSDHSFDAKTDWPDFMAAISPGRPLIGMATRFAADKGIKEFMEAIPALARRLPTARFVLAGDGPLLPWAKEYVSINGLSDMVSFPGFIKDVNSFWAYLDIALFTGPKEAFGIGIIEAQAASVVVVGYANNSGSDEIILQGETGVLVPWADQEALAREVEALWSDPPRYKQMAMAARRRLENHFSLEKMTQECLNLYKLLLSIAS